MFVFSTEQSRVENRHTKSTYSLDSYLIPGDISGRRFLTPLPQPCLLKISQREILEGPFFPISNNSSSLPKLKENLFADRFIVRCKMFLCDVVYGTKQTSILEWLIKAKIVIKSAPIML